MISEIMLAANAARSIAKTFGSFALVADMLENLGDIEDRERVAKEHLDSLHGEISKLGVEKAAAARETAEALVSRDTTMADRDKILDDAADEAAEIIQEAHEEATKWGADDREARDVWLEDLDAKQKEAEDKLSRALTEVDGARVVLWSINADIVAIKYQL